MRKVGDLLYNPMERIKVIQATVEKRISTFPERLEITTTASRASDVATFGVIKTHVIADRDNTDIVYMGNELNQLFELLPSQREEIFEENLFLLLFKANSGTQIIHLLVERRL